jgi:hypothetical protein
VTVYLPRSDVFELVCLAREMALAMDADSNADEDFLEVRLLRAVERVEQRLQRLGLVPPLDDADVGSRRADDTEDEA